MFGHALDDGATNAARRAGNDSNFAGEVEKRQGVLRNSGLILR
jgi:hypothetical protein